MTQGEFTGLLEKALDAHQAARHSACGGDCDDCESRARAAFWAVLRTPSGQPSVVQDISVSSDISKVSAVEETT